jgi:uncharacterized phage-associated protein
MPREKHDELTCFDVADYFLSLVDEEEGDLISNLKLQKLMYYAQGFHLAMYDKPLFSEPIEAWEHGPVIRALYSKYAAYGANPIPNPDSIDFIKLNDETKEFLNEVYNTFGQYSAWKLREMTHDETPWSMAFVEGESNIISPDSLKEYFKQFVET